MKMHRFAILKGVVFFLVQITCLVANAGVLDSCWKAAKKIAASEQSTLYEEDGRRYFSYGELEFGTKEDGESGFIKINDLAIGIESIKFKRNLSLAATFNIGAKDLNMLQGEVIPIRFNSTPTYCLIFPFSGLGASGNYAKYKALIAIPKTAKSPNDISGAIHK